MPLVLELLPSIKTHSLQYNDLLKIQHSIKARIYDLKGMPDCDICEKSRKRRKEIMKKNWIEFANTKMRFMRESKAIISYLYKRMETNVRPKIWQLGVMNRKLTCKMIGSELYIFYFIISILKLVSLTCNLKWYCYYLYYLLWIVGISHIYLSKYSM